MQDRLRVVGVQLQGAVEVGQAEGAREDRDEEQAAEEHDAALADHDGLERGGGRRGRGRRGGRQAEVEVVAVPSEQLFRLSLSCIYFFEVCVDVTFTVFIRVCCAGSM